MKDEDIQEVLSLLTGEDTLALVNKIKALMDAKGWAGYNNATLIEAAYKATPAVFYAISPYLNVFPQDNTKQDWYYLVQNDRHDIVFYMLERNFLYLAKVVVPGENYLMAAIRQAKSMKSADERKLIEMLPVILKSKVNINQEGSGGETPLYLAIKHEWFDLAKVLISHSSLDFASCLSSSSANWKILLLVLEMKKYDFLLYMFEKGFMSNHVNRGTDVNPLSALWHEYYHAGRSPQLIKCMQAFRKNNVNQSIVYTYQNQKPVTFSQMYLSKFGQFLPSEENIDKSVALKMVFTRMDMIMSSTILSMHFLSKFDEFLKKAWVEQFGNEVIPDFEVSMKFYSGLPWPVPTEGAKSTHARAFSKKGFLEKQCLNFMKSQGVNSAFYKLYGLIDAGTFKKLIADSSLFTELSLNPGFLLHGKNIHNISRAMFYIAWDENACFQKTFIENGETKTLTITDVLAVILKKEFANCDSKKSQWNVLFDTVVPYHVNYADVYQLHTLILNNPDKLPTLSALMRHSFCKSIFRIRDFLNETTSETWTSEDTWHHFITSEAPSNITAFTEAQVSWLRDKGKIPLEQVIDDKNLTVQHRFSPTGGSG